MIYDVKDLLVTYIGSRKDVQKCEKLKSNKYVEGARTALMHLADSLKLQRREEHNIIFHLC